MTALAPSPRTLPLRPTDASGVVAGLVLALALGAALALGGITGGRPLPAPAPEAAAHRNVPGGDPVAFAKAHAAGRAPSIRVLADPRLAPGLVPMGPIGGPSKLLPQ